MSDTQFAHFKITFEPEEWKVLLPRNNMNHVLKSSFF